MIIGRCARIAPIPLYNYIVIDAHARHRCTARRHYSHLPNVLPGTTRCAALCEVRGPPGGHSDPLRDKHTAKPNQSNWKAIKRKTNFHIGTNLTFQKPNKLELKEQVDHTKPVWSYCMTFIFFQLNFISIDGIDNNFDLISSWCRWKFST